LERTEYDESGLWRLGVKSPNHLYARDRTKTQVDQNYLGMHFAKQLDCFLTFGGFTDNVKPVNQLKKVCETLADHVVPLDNEYANLIRANARLHKSAMNFYRTIVHRCILAIFTHPADSASESW
jgi:hypothetical protein